MKLSVTKTNKLKGTVQIRPSKSLMHRYMIASYLAGAPVTVCDCACDDVKETNNALESIDQNKDIIINESGTTLRLILPLCAALNKNISLSLGGVLASRPIDELINCLNEHGAKIIKDGSLIKVQGNLSAGEYKINASVSSQYISALLISLPLLNGDSKIILEGEKVSKNYISITLNFISSFGIKVEEIENGYFIPGNQKYVSKELSLEPDWSSAAIILSAGALLGETKIKKLAYPSLQGDSAVVDILKSAGADIRVEEDGISAFKSELRAFSFSAKNCIDLVPILSIVAACASGESKISDVHRLKDKESNRLDGVLNLLKDFGIECRVEEDSLYIKGGTIKAHRFDFLTDHRMIMSAIVGAMMAEGESIIANVEHISKSYPGFLQDIIGMGGRIHVI